MNYETLSCDLSDNILTVTLNRPEKLNAFTVTMANELIDVFNQSSDNDEVRAIIVTGAGRAFCAGMDLAVSGNVFGLDESQHPTMKDMHERLDDPAIVKGVRDTGGRVSLSIFNCKKPVIGAINGAAVGVGVTMQLPMDIRLASEQAKFGFVFGKIGIVPEACSTWFLPRLVGLSKAMEWVHTAEIFGAEEAHRAGLVKEMLPADQLLTRARELARTLAERSPVSMAMARQMMYRNSAFSHPLEAHKVESLAMFYASIDDGKEGVTAFTEKRKPAFKTKASQMPDFYPWW
jgi:enoyl-CoA hydratase/carnithine racemase